MTCKHVILSFSAVASERVCDYRMRENQKELARCGGVIGKGKCPDVYFQWAAHDGVMAEKDEGFYI